MGFISLSYLPEELVATIIQVAADVRRLPLHSVLGPYGGGSDADARGENLENLRAMLAESDDDEGLLS